MSDAWPDEAVEFVQAIADTKLVLSHRYAEWMLAGPTLEDDIAGASAAQDEIGHVRQLFRLLDAQGRDRDRLEGEREPAEFCNAATLDSPPGDWLSFVAATAPTDRAAWYLLDAVVHEDFSGLIERIGGDEYFHLEYHDARLETVADDRPDALEAGLERELPRVLAFLGPATYDEATDPLLGVGFTDRPIVDVRESFREHYESLFADTGVSLDGVDWDAPDPDAWDETRRRVGDGTIDAAAVESLRGTKNKEFAAE